MKRRTCSMYRILIYVIIFEISQTHNPQQSTREFVMPPEGSPTNPEPTEKDDPKTFSRTEDGQDHVPTLEQLTQTVAQIQQQYKHLVAWQENTNNVFQSRMDSMGMESGNLQQGLQAFTQNTHKRLVELERTYAKSFLFTAFTATGSEAKAFTAGATIEFKDIITNEGGAYNPESSVFNCQYDGFFHFQFTIHTTGAYPVEVQLYNGGKPVISGYSPGNTPNDIISNAAVVFCEGGDQVMLKVKNDYQQRIQYDGRYSTFSGYAVAAVENEY